MKPEGFFDPVSGELAGKIINNLAKNGIVMTYGNLSNKPLIGIKPSTLIFSNIKIEGFHIALHLLSKVKLESLKKEI